MTWSRFEAIGCPGFENRVWIYVVLQAWRGKKPNLNGPGARGLEFLLYQALPFEPRRTSLPTRLGYVVTP